MTIEFKRVSTEDATLRMYSGLLMSVFGHEKKFELESIRWRYKDNPDGEAIGFDAFDGEKLVGHYVTTPINASVDGQLQKGLLSLNTAVDSNYRGKNIFPVISKNTFELAKELGFDFVIGVANSNSTKIFLKRLGFQLVAPLKTGFFLYSDWTYKGADFELVKHEEWLKWRLSNPAQSYYLKKRKEHLIISTPTHIPFIYCSSFMRNIFALGKSRTPIGINLFMGLDNGCNFQFPFFISIPEKFKPSPLNFIYRSLSGKTPKLSGSVNFSFLDFDPY